MKFLIPFVDKSIGILSDSFLDILAYLFVAIISMDLTLTVSSLVDFRKYVESIGEEVQNQLMDIINRITTYKNRFYRNTLQRIVAFKFSGRKNKIAKQLREESFKKLIKDYLEHDVVKEMNNHIHHGTTTTLEHCENVAWISY